MDKEEISERKNNNKTKLHIVQEQYKEISETHGKLDSKAGIFMAFVGVLIGLQVFSVNKILFQSITIVGNDEHNIPIWPFYFMCLLAGVITFIYLLKSLHVYDYEIINADYFDNSEKLSEDQFDEYLIKCYKEANEKNNKTNNDKAQNITYATYSLCVFAILMFIYSFVTIL